MPEKENGCVFASILLTLTDEMNTAKDQGSLMIAVDQYQMLQV